MLMDTTPTPAAATAAITIRINVAIAGETAFASCRNALISVLFTIFFSPIPFKMMISGIVPNLPSFSIQSLADTDSYHHQPY